MIKRGILALADNKFRISAPGVDVDTATVAGLLIHESVLFSQVMQSGYATNPRAGAMKVSISVANNMAFNVHIVSITDYNSFRVTPTNYVYSSVVAAPNLAHVWTIDSASVITFQFFSVTPAGVSYVLLRKT